MAQPEIFIEKEIECPACSSKGVLRYPNPKLYRAAKRDSDLRTVSYNWVVGGCENIKPHYYSVWKCDHCNFAFLTDDNEEPEGASKKQYRCKAFQIIPNHKQKILDELCMLIPEDGVDETCAVAKHIIALLIASLPEADQLDHNYLGRVSLRLGWLYRERKGNGDSESDEGGLISELHDNIEYLENQIIMMTEAVSNIGSISAARISELGLKTDKNPYSPVVSSLCDKLVEMQPFVTMLQRTLIRDRSGELAEIAPENAGSPGSDLDQVIVSLKGSWPQLPANEKEALYFAANSFEHSYNFEDTYHSIEQSMTIIRLMIDLRARVGEYEKALRLVSELYKCGMESKQELKRRISEGKQSKRLREHDEKMLNHKINTINATIQQAGEHRRELLEIIIKKYDSIIEKVLLETEGRPISEREKALRTAGVPREVVSNLKARKVLKEEKKSKGLLGGLFR